MPVCSKCGKKTGCKGCFVSGSVFNGIGLCKKCGGKRLEMDEKAELEHSPTVSDEIKATKE